jgi:hypothetical protein
MTTWPPGHRVEKAPKLGTELKLPLPRGKAQAESQFKSNQVMPKPKQNARELLPPRPNAAPWHRTVTDKRDSCHMATEYCQTGYQHRYLTVLFVTIRDSI